MIRPLLLSVLLAPFLHAATYIVPPDAELIQKADAIVIATGVSSFAERNARGAIVTRATLRVEETLKGEVGAHVVLTELGGVAGERSRIVAGAPRYLPGMRYLVFLSTNCDLEPATLGMSLGRFQLEGDLAVRHAINGFDSNLEPHVERLRDAQRFTSYIRDVVAQRYAAVDYFVAPSSTKVSDAAVLVYSRTSYLLDENGIGYRWRNPSVTWVRNGTQPGSDGAAAVAKGLAQWNGTNSAIDLHNGGVDPTAVAGLDPNDGKNGILFNDPDNEISDATGVVGVGSASGGAEYEYEGERFFDIVEGDVVVANQPFGQSCLDTILTHELGHTLGIRHSNDPPDALQCGVNAQCTSDAIMNSGIQCAWNGLLRGWDHNAASTVYGDGVVCEPPVIATQPASITVARGALIRVSVDVTGTEPFRYEWFEGARGVKTRPVGTGSRELVLPAGRAASTRFWVLVTNDCGSVESFTAAITIPVSVRRRPSRH